MYEPNSGIDIPRFTIPGVPDLEDALNSLSDAIQKTASKTKSFESSSDIRAVDNGSSVLFELVDQDKSYVPKRFEIFYDRFRSRVHVYEGRVSVNLNGVDTTVVPTIDKVKILLPGSPGFSELGIQRPASFDVKTKIPPTDGDNTPVFKIYLKVLTAAEDENDRFSLIFHNYSEQGHPSETIVADLFFEIGEIFKANNKVYINQKWSSDITLSPLVNCTFQVTDVTKYPKEKLNPDDPEEEWPGLSDFKVSIRNAKILGRYPDGMSEDAVYKLSIEQELMEKPQFYVYAKVMLDEYGILQDYDKAVTIEVSEYWLSSGSCIQRIPIARISPIKSSEGEDKYKLEIENYCPLIDIKQPNNCDFEIEDATDTIDEVKIQVKRSAVDGRYPKGMEERNTPYQFVLPSESDWFAVYVVIELNSDGAISDNEDPITIGIYDEYRNNEPLIQYSLVGEVNVSIREDNTRYISYIKNICQEVTVNKETTCPFELYDASDYDDEGIALNAKVFVTSTEVFDGKYADGMSPDARYVISITEEDTKLAGVTPAVGICYIYLKVLVDEFGVVQDYATAITIEKTARWYPDRGCSVQRFLIGSVQVENDGQATRFLSLASMCPIVSLNRDACCPFIVEDSSEDDKLKVQIRTGKVGGKYPAGMEEKGVYVLELPSQEDFHLIYCVSVLTADGYLYPDREDGDSYVSFTIEKDYVTNTENLQYDLIAIVNTNQFEIVSIQNSCYEPVFKKPEECAFALYDASEYENTAGPQQDPKWEATNCKVLVTQSSIRGKYPEGMSGDPKAPPFVLTFSSSDFAEWGEASIERCYVYLLAIVDNKGEISTQDSSLTIEKSPYWYDSDSSVYQRILIGWVDANIDGGITMYSVHSDCPNLSLRRPSDCRFKIEDASDLKPNGQKKVVIRNGKINGRYPEGMDEDTIYTINLPDDTVGEYYVFAVISIDQNGNALEGEDGGPEISFSIEKEYKQNTSTEYYAIIGTIYLNENGQLNIVSYCLDPSLEDKNRCPFELYDASDYDANGEATNAKVLVSNYRVFGNRYADGMDSESSFVLSITPEDTKVGGVTPAIGICYIYLEVLVDEYGEVFEYDTAITISKTSAWYQERGCCTQRFMIGSVQVQNTSSGSKFISVSPACPVIALNRDSCCPFLVENVSDEDGLKVQVRTGTVGGKYPAGMEERGRYVLELPEGEDFHLIYCVSVLTADGYLYPDREDGDSYVSFTIEKDYVTNTENLQYDLIAIVNTNQFEIVSIQNSCYEPVFKKPEECAFALYDASEYENTAQQGQDPKWEATNCKVLVTQSSIRGKYPEGMSGDPKAEPYVLTFTESDFENWGVDENQRCYVYLLVLVKDNGDILEQENSVTIEKSPYWYDSDSSSYQRILIGWVDATSNATIVAVHSECPNLSLKKPANCLFKIEDATDLTADGEKKVVIRNGRINGRYPEGMDAETLYEISLPQETVGDYYVYAVISIDQNGMALEGEDGGPEISFSIEKDYKQNTSTEVYSIIGTINLNELGQLTIQSYCLDPSIPERNLCPFELYDASDYDNQGKPTNAKVLVSNYSVFGDRYADGMGAETSFVLTIVPDDTKLGNVIPENGICYIYLEVLVDEYGEVLPEDTAITIGKTSAWYQDRGCSIQRFLIGSVQVTNEGSTSKFSSVSSLCPIIALNKDACCPFLVEDASDVDGLKVQVRTGTVGGKYPAGMEKRGRYVLDLPEAEDFHLIYCVSVLTADGYLYPDREDGDDYVSFVIEKDYVTNTENLQYDLIAIVNTNQFEIVSIQNSCYEPVFKQRSGCDFAVYDASDYENTGTEEKPKWESTNCKVLVTQSSIRGIYPEGMSGDPKAPDYILTLAAADFTNWEGSDGVQRCYIYLKVLVDDDDGIYTLANSVTIETGPFWSRNDNHTYQRILIGWVEATSSMGSGPKMLSVQSACPDLVLNKRTNCPFKLEDASDLTIDGTKQVMITNGKINDRYPQGMEKNTIYNLAVPSPTTGSTDKIYYVYAVISIDQYGRALPGQDGGSEISFAIEDEYKYNTADTYYAVIGTVEFDADKQLIITSYCIDPSISSSVESCGFKTTDASTWAAGASAPSKIAVRIQSSKIDGKYPDGMGDEADFVLELVPADFNEEGICYIYAKAVLNPSGEVPDATQNKPLTIEKVSKYQPKGNFVQHIPIAHVYTAPVAGGSGKEIVKITNFCPTGQLYEINTCAFFTEDVTDYSDNTRTKLSVLVANRKVYGELPSNMSEQTCFEYEFTIDNNVEVYYVCCKIPTDRYGLYNEAAAGQDNILISIEKQEPKSTTYHQWFVLATIYVDVANQYIWDIQNYCYVPEAKARNCFFQVTDACTYDADFNPTGPLKVEVDQWSIPNVENPNQGYPTGMGNDNRYLLTLPDDSEWYGIFLNIQVNQENEILTTDNAVTLSVETYMPEGTSTYQRFYLAGINISENEDGDRYISYIDNKCTYVAVKPPPSCPFLVEDASKGDDCKIQIRSGRIANKYPTDMNGTSTYTLTVSDEQTWWVVYCGMVVSDGEIQTGEGQVTFYLSDKYLTNTESFVNFKIAEIQTYLDENNDRYVGWVDNVCAVPFVSSGASLPCPFKVLDVSDEDGLKIAVTWGLIWNMLPTGMYPDDDPQLVMDVTDTCFLYSKIVFDSSLIVTEVAFSLETSLVTNTANTQYNIIAVIDVKESTGSGGGKYIAKIRNSCMQPFPSPCSLT